MNDARLFDGKRVVYAPHSYRIGSSANTVISVNLADDEDVEWHWSHGQSGSVVTGYSIRKKLK